MNFLSSLHPRTRRIVLIFFSVYVLGPALTIATLFMLFTTGSSPYHYESLREGQTLSAIKMVYIEEISEPTTYKVYRNLDDVNLDYVAGELANTDYYVSLGHTSVSGFCFQLLYTDNSSMFFCEQGIAIQDQDGTVNLTHGVVSVNNNFNLLWEKYYGFPIDNSDPVQYDASIPEN